MQKYIGEITGIVLCKNFSVNGVQKCALGWIRLFHKTNKVTSTISINLVDVSDILYFFLAGEGEGGVRGAGRGGVIGSIFNLRSQKGGRGRGAGRVSAANSGMGGGGGGLNIFFGAEM